MRTKIIILLALVTAFIGRAQISTIDTTNVSYTHLTNTVTAGGLTVPGVFTNQPYSTVNNSNKNIGDLNPVAWGKVNANFAVLAGFTNSLTTNGATADGQIPVRSNGVAVGYKWIPMPTIGTGGITNLVPTNAAVPSVSGGTGFIPTNSTSGGMTNICVTNNGVIFQFNINGQFVCTNTVTHAYTLWNTNGYPTSIDQYGGMEQCGTNWWTVGFTNGNAVTFSNGLLTVNSNLSVAGTTWLNSSNLEVYYVQSTNMMPASLTNTVTNYSNYPSGLIPIMTGYTTPSGTASASSEYSTYYAWRAFNTNGNIAAWSNTDPTSWLQYEFDSAVIAGGCSFAVNSQVLKSNAMVFSYSSDGVSWVNLASTNYFTSPTEWTYMSFPPVSGRFFRWTFNFSIFIGQPRFFQIYASNFPRNVIDGKTSPISILATNGLMINTNTLSTNTDGTTSILNENGSMNNTGGYYVNGVQLVTASPLQYLISSNLMVSGATNGAAALNGKYVDSGHNYLTNTINQSVLIEPIGTIVVNGTNFTGSFYALGTNITAFIDNVLDPYFYSANLVGAYLPGSGQATNYGTPVVSYSTDTFSNQVSSILQMTGLTTNIQFTDTAVFGGSTNTLHFINGILKAVTSP